MTKRSTTLSPEATDEARGVLRATRRGFLGLLSGAALTVAAIVAGPKAALASDDDWDDDGFDDHGYDGNGDDTGYDDLGYDDHGNWIGDDHGDDGDWHDDDDGDDAWDDHGWDD